MKQENNERKAFHVSEILLAFTDLPRVLRLVWHACPVLVIGMAFVMFLQGITPLATVLVARLLIDRALQGITQRTLLPIILPVALQLAINLITRFCTRLQATLQVLLNFRLSDHLELLILRKASTLDLASFENAAFYDRLNHLCQDALNKPLMMIIQLFGLGSSLVTMLSLLGLLFHLSWWLVLVALIVPIPSFIADTHYGLKNYWKVLWNSPRRRQQLYIRQLLTADSFNKEIKLFNLANFFTERYHLLSEEMYQEEKRLQYRHTIINLLWSILPVIANAGIYVYVALQAVQRRISLGALTQYTLAITQTSQSFQAVLDGFSNIYEHHLFVDSLFEFLASEPQIFAPAHPLLLEASAHSHGLDIEFRNVSFIYPGKREAALRNISFTVACWREYSLSRPEWCWENDTCQTADTSV